MNKTIYTFISAIIISLLIVSSSFASSLTVEYINNEKLLELRGSVAGASGDVSVVMLYNYNPSNKGVGDETSPLYADAFFLGTGGSVNHDFKLPETLPGGKYVVRISTSDGYEERIFMHVNDALAPSSLAEINSASEAGFASALATYGPGCGLDPDVYDAYKSYIAPMLYAYKGTGFKDTNSFMKLANQATAAAKIKSDGDVEAVLRDYGAYLKESTSDANAIDCALDYSVKSDGVKAIFYNKIKTVNFASSKGFCKLFRETLILSEFSEADSWTDVRDVILGMNNNIKVNNNFNILSPNTEKYNKLVYPEEVFGEVYKRKAEVNSFDGIVSLFESCAEGQYNAENEEKETVIKPNPGTPSRPTGSPSGSPSVSVSGSPAVTPDLISGSANTVSLKDISGHWAEDTINILVKKNVLTGYADGSFKPENSVSRSEFVAMIVKAFNINAKSNSSFSDVSSSHWAYDYIMSACGAGIVTGYDEGNFGADDLITREQAAAVIYRVITHTHTIPEGSSDFYDIGSVSTWALRPVLDLAGEGLINGVGKNIFSPASQTTRAQAAILINNALEYMSVK